MRRSKRNLDEWIDQLASGEHGFSGGDTVATFVDELGSASLPGDSVREDIPGLLAAEALSATTTVSTWTSFGRTKQPLARKWRRRSMISTFLSTLLGKLAIATKAVAAAGGGLAASDNLPDPAQEWVAGAVSHIGIDLPAPSHADLPSQTDGVESPDAPELPDDASDTADPVIETVFDGGTRRTVSTSEPAWLTALQEATLKTVE